MEARSRQRWLLILSASAFALWISYLFYLVLMHDRPEIHFAPFEIQKTPEIVVSRSQLLESDLVVSGRWMSSMGRPKFAKSSRAGPVCLDPRRIVSWWCSTSLTAGSTAGTGPGIYLLPLKLAGKDYGVTRVPSTPGYPRGSPGRPGPPSIYPDRPEISAQIPRTAP